MTNTKKTVKITLSHNSDDACQLLGKHWTAGKGEAFQSINAATQEVVWQGRAATEAQVKTAVKASKQAAKTWNIKPFAERRSAVLQFSKLLKARQEEVATLIAREIGKPLWEARTEAAAMVGKVALSIEAYRKRTDTVVQQTPAGMSYIRYRPHGVIAVFGPYNFPGHLPNGHIIPALLAGNTVIFKPSEQTPAVAEWMTKLWQQAGLPDGVLTLVQGGKETGMALAAHPDLNGLFFTGSSATGKALHQQYSGQTGKILALEMGGNNPLIIGELKDIKAAVHDTIQSAFISAGQRCTCARRLFVPNTPWGDQYLEALINATKQIKVGTWNENPAPFMGALVSAHAAELILQAQQNLQSLGGTSLVEAKLLKTDTGLLSPAIIDVTAIKDLPDVEYFGPLLQVIRYDDFEQAIDAANHTRFGLSAGLLSINASEYQYFLQHIKAGVVNWNKPITGASSSAPFGGIGDSGNHHPSAYFAADYCAYPIASIEASAPKLPDTLAPGLVL